MRSLMHKLLIAVTYIGFAVLVARLIDPALTTINPF